MHSAWQVCAWLSDVKNLNEGPLSETRVSVNPDLGFVVGGVSSGGSLAAVIGGIAGASAGENSGLLEGLNRLDSPITGIFAGIPLLVTEKMLPEPYRRDFYSREQNAFNEGLTTPMIRKVEENLKANVESPWFSPVNIDFTNPEIAQHHPKKVFTYSCEFDPLRDDAAIYEKCLSKSSSIETRITMVKEAVHTAWVTLDWPAAHTPLIKLTTLDGMGWLLGKEFNKDMELSY
jgi:acetyl esterase/lipase